MSDAKKLSSVLYAFLARMSNHDLMKIMDAKDSMSYASMNLGNSSQLAAMKDLNAAIDESIEAMFYHDQDIIESVIKREFGEQ